MTIKAIRLLQIFIIACLAFYTTLIFLGNIQDYHSNYEFVKHVLAMDTTFPGNHLMWRAITHETVIQIAYWGIISAEGIVALLGWIATIQLCLRQNASAEIFNKSKTLGFYAFILAITIWFIGFICIGSEWFAMWQSSKWNGKKTAMDIVTVISLFLTIYILPVADLVKKNLGKISSK